jgi:3-phenylpropionate/cinnamic acid dioxygenase small subunit
VVNRKTSTARAASLLRPSDPDYMDALIFLTVEAELLDSGDFAGWLDLLAPEVVYTVPVRPTRLRGERPRGPERSFHRNEDRASIEFRIKRILESDFSWAYNPPSRHRRFVSNLRVRRGECNDLKVSSYLLLMRSRGDRDAFEFITAERSDLLDRGEDGSLELRSREVTVDQALLGMSSLPFPL